MTSFLNNAANEDDIYNGTAYASKVGIRVTMPRWGVSKGEYFFDREENIIAKGVSSIKFMSAKLASQMYDLSQRVRFHYFVDLLSALFAETCIDTRQLDMLIKIDFFSAFGNQRELLRITDFYLNTFKKGCVKQIRKSAVEGTPLEHIVRKYSVGVTKSGGEAKSYTVMDVDSILRETEEAVKAAHMDDLSMLLKVRNFEEVMGYAGYVSGDRNDRRKVYVTDVRRANDRNGRTYGYHIFTKGIFSGKESRLTVKKWIFDRNPIRKGDLITILSYEQAGNHGLIYVTSYEKVI